MGKRKPKAEDVLKAFADLDPEGQAAVRKALTPNPATVYANAHEAYEEAARRPGNFIAIAPGETCPDCGGQDGHHTDYCPFWRER